ncbi:MAG: DUF1501 domain-containing protein, partial [Pirellula sp.]
MPRDPKSNSLAPKDLTFFPGLDETRLLRRKQFLQTLDRQERRLEQESIAASSSSPLEQAYRMTLNRETRSAFRLEDESPKTHARYGDRLLGQCCLLARRLVEH